MNEITQIFFLLSNSLLIPVMLLLLISVLRILFLTGNLLFEFIDRQRDAPQRLAIVEACKTRSLHDLELTKGSFGQLTSGLLSTSTDMAHTDFVIRQMQLNWQRRLDTLRGLVKLGPSLGLMGTLIPLGPALVGLAVGDIQTMSNNLVIAFSTTVLGLFVGMLAGYLVSLRKHWYADDAALIDFVAERLQGHGSPLHLSTADPASIELEDHLHA